MFRYLIKIYYCHKLKKIPKILLDDLINNRISSPKCSSCKWCINKSSDHYCKIINDIVDPGKVCDEHVYAAKFLVKAYYKYQADETKTRLNYRDSQESNNVVS